jgi:hypothetical protein
MNKMNNIIVNTARAISTISMGNIIIALIIFTFFGCSKNPLKRKGAKKTVEGIVYIDCNGNVSKGTKVYLNNSFSGCFGSGELSKDSTLTDNNGQYKFQYRENVDDGSTTSQNFSLTIPNSLIRVINPSGNINLYPNDTIMNAVINLKFNNKYTSMDTFYFQFKPSPKGFVEEPEQIQFIVGPFRDTTINLNNLRIGNINNLDNGNFHCGSFKWGIGKLRLNSYYTGYDGSFFLTHKPCANTDIFDYNVVPHQ